MGRECSAAIEGGGSGNLFRVTGEGGFQFVQSLTGAVIGRESGEHLELLDKGMKRRIDVIRVTSIDEFVMRLVQALAQPLGEPRFADTGLAFQEDDLTLTPAGAQPQLLQPSGFFLAPDQWRQTRAGLAGLEPAFVPQRPVHPPNLHRLADAFQGMRSQGSEDEPVSQKAAGRVRDHDLIGTGEG